MPTRDIRSEKLHRTFALDRAGADDEQRTVPASLSSEPNMVPRWFGIEKLLHTEEAVDLARAVNGLPLLFNHNTDQPIGIVRDVRIEGDRLRGTLHFSRNPKATEVWGDVKDGFLSDLSIGYHVDDWDDPEKGSDIVNVTRWTLLEASVVTVPADATVGVNRAYEDRPMPDNAAGSAGTQAPAPQPAELARQTEAHVINMQTAAEIRGGQIERERTNEIDTLFSLPRYQSEQFQELGRQAKRLGWTTQVTRDALLDMVGRDTGPIAGSPPQQSQYAQPQTRGSVLMPPTHVVPFVQAGRDSRDGMGEGMRKAIWARSVCSKPKDKAALLDGNEYAGMSLLELMRANFQAHGVDCRGWSADMLISHGLNQIRTTPLIISHTTSDFGSITLDSANKAMMTGFKEAPETWPEIAKAVSLNNFLPHNRLNMSTFGDLEEVPEAGEYRYGTFSDLRESMTLKTYGKLFTISRQAIINDNVGAFTDIPMHMGRAATRMIGDAVYAVLTTNPTLNQDSLALFHATHANLITSGAVPSVATLNAAFTWMATRTDPAGNVLNMVPKKLIVPRALEPLARTLIANQYDPAGTAGTLPANPWNGMLEVVGDARLDAFNAAGWFVSADPNAAPTIEVGFLNGSQEPFLDQEQAFTQDGVAFKVRIDVVAAPMDFRGLYYNDGA